MSEGQDRLTNSTVLEAHAPRVRDALDRIGPRVCSGLMRVLKSARMFGLDHAQTQAAARQYAGWLNAAMMELSQDTLALQMAENSLFLDGSPIRLDSQALSQMLELRARLMQMGTNQIQFASGIAPGELLDLLREIRRVQRQGGDLSTFRRPHLALARAEDIGGRHSEIGTDTRRELIELYATLLIQCQVYFARIRKNSNPSAKHVKRIVQRIAEHIGTRSDVFVGLINLRLVTGHEWVHATHRALYSMMLASATGLGPLDVVRCGMTALTQDIDKFEPGELDADALQIGDETHFRTNLSSVISLSRIGTMDVLSGLRLVTNYERGFPCKRPLPRSWYAGEMTPHMLTSIVEIARDYDLLTQGLGGHEPMSPDMALHAIMDEMGRHYDPDLTWLFINLLGIFPVGCVVELSDGRTALVTKSSPTLASGAVAQAARPVVRLLHDGDDTILNLASPQYQSLYIVRILQHHEVEHRPTALLLF